MFGSETLNLWWKEIVKLVFGNISQKTLIFAFSKAAIKVSGSNNGCISFKTIKSLVYVTYNLLMTY